MRHRLDRSRGWYLEVHARGHRVMGSATDHTGTAGVVGSGDTIGRHCCLLTLRTDTAGAEG